MAVYPIKMMKDESGQPFVPLTSLDAVIGEKNLQYILDAEELGAGHFRVNFKDLEMKDITNSIIVVRWPQITSTVKPSYLKLNNNTEAILYDGTGKEHMDLEDASGTINLLAYDGTKWIQATGSGSGGGHVITDGEGHSMEQQKVLSFVGFNVENDAANRATKIVNPTPINNLTTTESGQGSLDAYQGNILSKRSVPTGGTKGQVLAKSGDGDHQLQWVDKDSDDVVTSDGSVKEIVGLTYEEYKALEAAGQLKPTTQYHITDMGDTAVGLTEASMVEFSDGTNLESKMTTKDIMDNGQNDRLDIAENNIDTIVNTVNTLSQKTTPEYCQITYTQNGGSIEFTQLYAGVRVPFDRLHSRSGNLTFESNGVKVGAGISKVRVTYGLNVSAVNTASNFTIQCTAGGYQYTRIDGLSFFTQTCICNVTEGEVIQITVAEQGRSSNTMSFYCNSSQPVCYLLVEKIA